MKITGWGKFPLHNAKVSAPRTLRDFREAVSRGGGIARGLGRSYGDSSISQQNTIDTRHLKHMISFDAQTGYLIAEAGVVLADILPVVLSKGWFPCVTPGTKFVTIGGMIASDVHGKNHHGFGSMRNAIVWFDLLTQSGDIIRCSDTENTDFFEWTIGGMGLTGVILQAELRFQKVETAWIKQTTTATAGLRETIAQFEAAQDATYCVAWIDCLAQGDQLGRSLVLCGEHAQIGELSDAQKSDPLKIPKKRTKSIPFHLPAFALNRLSVGVFNRWYYTKGQKSQGTEIVDWDSYFYPLDSVLGWNKIYGSSGFAQFQCVLPLETSKAGLTELLQIIASHGQASFLAVLKRMGPEIGKGLSFPMEGYTLALDFPMKANTLDMLCLLDEIVLRHGGRFYLTKDSRMSASTLKQSDPRAIAFSRFREKHKIHGKFTSEQSKRLKI